MDPSVADPSYYLDQYKILHLVPCPGFMDITSLVEQFNSLPRPAKSPLSPAADNHWHFEIRSGHMLTPPADMIQYLNIGTEVSYLQGDAQILDLSLPLTAIRAQAMLPLLLYGFVGGLGGTITRITGNKSATGTTNVEHLQPWTCQSLRSLT